MHQLSQVISDVWKIYVVLDIVLPQESRWEETNPLQASACSEGLEYLLQCTA